MAQESLLVEYKDEKHRDPVTAADRAVEERIRLLVRSTFPGHAVLGEEEGASTSAAQLPSFLWVVDPIDGTANYAARLPFWAVSIGVLYRRRPIAAAIFTPAGPNGPAVYHAAAGKGAFCDDAPIHVRDNTEPQPGTVIGVPGSWPNYWHLAPRLRKAPGEVRVIGSIAAEMALTAAGVLQYSVYGGPKIWDCAAGVLIVKEAGGEVLRRDGRRWMPLEQFDPPPERHSGTAKSALGRLGSWRAPLLCGNPALAGFVAANLSPRFQRRLTVYRWWRGLRRRFSSSSAMMKQDKPA